MSFLLQSLINTNMANRIPVHHLVVIQTAPRGVSNRLQLMLGRVRVAELLQQREIVDNRVYARVTAERAAAVAWGVHVVVDDTKPDHYQKMLVPD
jgi:hypothetical protein